MAILDRCLRDDAVHECPSWCCSDANQLSWLKRRMVIVLCQGEVAAQSVEIDKFEVFFKGPPPQKQTLVFPGLVAPEFFGSISAEEGDSI